MHPSRSSHQYLYRCRYWCILVLTLVVIGLLCSAADGFISCSTSGNYTANSIFQKNLNQMMLSLTVSTPATGFNATTAGLEPDQVYGLALCRGDVPGEDCRACVANGTSDMINECPGSKEVRIWSDYCYIHYSEKMFVGTIDDLAKHWWCKYAKETNQDLFNRQMGSLLGNLSSVAVSDPSGHLFATGDIEYTDFVKIYGMVQCTRDLSLSDCNSCLAKLVSNLPNRPQVCNGTQGSIWAYGSCFLRYDIQPFIIIPGAPPPPANPTNRTAPPPEELNNRAADNGKHKTLVIALSTAISVAAVLFVICTGVMIIMGRRKGAQLGRTQSSYLSPANVTHQPENMIQEQRAELRVFDLDAIRVATDNFSDANKLGQGGFGPVYRGKLLPSGEDVAVKRLSLESGQGTKEFITEIRVVAQLQHRNLVRLLGGCDEGNEKLLVYEYVHNTSLDRFLFDPARRALLDWQKRLKIITGVARGLLYLHEDSRLRVIHRDLKASNVLLDKEMNPKIADFGLARNFEGDQTRAHTLKIGGTQGYMAPEYMLHGQFSAKSDVFSFGVLVLEIVSGKRNVPGKHNLLEYAWRHWRDERALELMDTVLARSCQITEVLRCIHIGLLSVQDEPEDRPDMSSVVMMLNSNSVALPTPSPPTFFTGNRQEWNKTPTSRSDGSSMEGPLTGLEGR